jgi:hypothetical protein
MGSERRNKNMYERRRGLQKMLVTVLALVAVNLASGQGMGDMGSSRPGHMGEMGQEETTGRMGQMHSGEMAMMHQMMPMMGGMGQTPAVVPRFPPVQGFANGGVVFFIHPEASDPEVSQMLSLMMGSPVVTVPSLANAPEEALADVFVFTNGVSGMGPMGFQPDVLNSMPGTAGYSPLRRLNLVTWESPESGRVLRSAAEVMEAQESGEVSIERPGVVINMPVVKWPLGTR